MTTAPDQDPPKRRLAALYARLLLSHRRVITILLALATLGMAIGLLQLRFDSEPRSIFQRSDDEFARLEQYFEDFGADDNNVLLVLHGDNLFSPELARALREFAEQAAALAGVERVVSLLDVPSLGGPPLLPAPDASPEEFTAAREAATTHRFAAGQLISPGGNTLVATIVLTRDDPQTIQKLRPVFDALKELRAQSFAELPVEAAFAGSVAIRIETLLGVRREFFKITALGSIVGLLVALVLFRCVSTLLIVAAGPATAVIWTLGLMGWLDLDIEGISTPLPTIVFVVAFANAVHLMLDIRKSRRHGEEPLSAARTAIGHLGLACVLTSLTTAIGFGSLMLAETGSVQRFGMSAAIGSLLGLLANLTVIPLLASVFSAPPRRPVDADPLHPRPGGPLASVARALLRCSGPITFLALLGTAVLLWAALQLRSDIKWTETLPANAEVVQAMERLDREFGATLPCVVVVEWGEGLAFSDREVLEVFHRIERLVQADPTFRNPLSMLNFLPALPPAQLSPTMVAQVAGFVPPAVLGRVLRPELRRGVLSMSVPNAGAAATRPAFHRMRNDLAALQDQFPDFRIHLTGSSVVAAENMSSVIGDLVRSLSFASITVFLVLTVALRSLTLGLVSIVPNAFPLLLNAGVLYLLDKPLQITSVLTFSICLGIAVDDTIHFLIRFIRERERGCSVRDAIAGAFENVGLALLITTAIIMGGFAAAMTSAMPGLVFFGGLACSALCAALLGDLIFLPALLDRVVGKEERLARREERATQRRERRARRR